MEGRKGGKREREGGEGERGGKRNKEVVMLRLSCKTCLQSTPYSTGKACC